MLNPPDRKALLTGAGLTLAVLSGIAIGSNGLKHLGSGELPPPHFRGCSLMKWQNDTDDHIHLLKSRSPNDEHIIIFLRRETGEHSHRMDG